VLATRRFGSGASLVALHGFTHTGEQFASLADPLGREVIAPDLPGHGDSPLASTARDDVIASLAELIESIPGHVPVLAYSQGARLALVLATQTRSITGRLILVSGTAGVEDAEVRKQRAAWDLATGREIIEIGIEAFIDEWTTGGMTSTTGLPAALRLADREERLVNTAEGLASALAGYGQGTLPNVWHLLPSIAVPVLIVTGSQDATYTHSGARMTEAIGANAVHRVIEGAGHGPLLDSPVETIRSIQEFLAS
jgi:2-succinyl-6-hydroxy-2,4-cyclohexadiene-1-carboxylate synthase